MPRLTVTFFSRNRKRRSASRIADCKKIVCCKSQTSLGFISMLVVSNMMMIFRLW